MRGLISKVWVLVDLVFPCPQPRTKAEVAAEEKRRALDEIATDRLINGLLGEKDDLASYLASCKDLLAAEQERRQGVDARLTTIIGLSSIAGTIVIGTMITPRAPHDTLGRLLAWGLLYLALQLSSAILAAVLGLGRRGYRASMPCDVLPVPGEVRTVHLRRQIRTCLAMLADDRSLTNQKVTMMAVSHRALKNFLGGLLILAIIGTTQAVTTKPTDDLVERLRQDHALQDVLRGPARP